ncbi:TPA: hypothetical protein ACPYU1_001058 [Raoultella planticola]
MNSTTFTALATGLLVAAGFAQVIVLIAQRRQQRLDWVEVYRQRWSERKKDWINVVYIGRQHGSYYQVADIKKINKLDKATLKTNNSHPTIWALNSTQKIFGLLSDICLKILQGKLLVQDIYPIFGTEFLRHSVAIRAIIDGMYSSDYGRIGPNDIEKLHEKIRREARTWLICHDGIRRRCLILIDLLWAEASRLEDLPPDDLKSAADVKKISGDKNRKRLLKESTRLNSPFSIIRILFLVRFLRHSEYRNHILQIGINPDRLETLRKEWDKKYIN